MFDITPTEWTAILLSIKVATVATLVATPLGITLAYLLARRDFWASRCWMPPSICRWCCRRS